MTTLAVKLPHKIREAEETYAIKDGAGRSVSYVYFCDEEQRRGVVGRFTRTEARGIAPETARALTEAAKR